MRSLLVVLCVLASLCFLPASSMSQESLLVPSPAAPEPSAPPDIPALPGTVPTFPPSSLKDAELDSIAVILKGLEQDIVAHDPSRLNLALKGLTPERREGLVARFLEIQPGSFTIEANLDAGVEEIEPGQALVVHGSLSAASAPGAGQWSLQGIPATFTFRKDEAGAWRLVDTDADRFLVSPETALKWAGGACMGFMMGGLLYMLLVIWMAVDCGRRDWRGRETWQIVWFALLFAGCGFGPLLYLVLIKARQWDPRARK